jgi:uncharacterized protein
MFYVDPTRNQKSNKINNNRFNRKNNRQSVEQEKSVFQTTLQETITEQTNKDIEELLSDIEKTGQALYSDSTINNLRLYKDAVKRFLTKASRSTFKVGILRGRKIDLKILRVIDEKLKFLTDNFLELQKDKMNLLSEIEEIKGLVINIVY